jgi:hypothetical protein
MRRHRSLVGLPFALAAACDPERTEDCYGAARGRCHVPYAMYAALCRDHGLTTAAAR